MKPVNLPTETASLKTTLLMVYGPIHTNRSNKRCGFTAAVVAQSVERVDRRAGGRGFDSWGRTNTQGLKITEK